MPHGKKVILILLCLFFIIILIFTIIKQNKKPVTVINKEINLLLPSTSKIIHFDYNSWSEDFDTKIVINVEDIERIQKDLLSFFRQEYDIQNNSYIPSVKNSVAWWDMDERNILHCYFTTKDGRKHLFLPSAKTKEIWAFIVHQNDGNYYLYISSFS